jgi:hypothetical protein
VRHLWEAGRLGIGETESEKMDCPALSLQDAMSALTTAAYGRPLKLSWNGRRLKGPKLVPRRFKAKPPVGGVPDRLRLSSRGKHVVAEAPAK